MPFSVQKLDTFAGHRDAVYAITGGAAPHEVYSAGGDGQVVGWDLRRPDLGTLVAQVPAPVYALAFDAPRQELWVGQNFEGIHRIDPVARREVASLKLTSAPIFDLIFYENTAFAALGDGTVAVLDRAAFAVRTHLNAAERPARCLAANALTRELAVGYSDFTVKIFDLDTLVPRRVLTEASNSVFSVAYSPDGRRLYAAGRDAHLRAYDATADYALLHDVPAHLFAINHLTFSPDARYLATASMDKSIKIWEPGTLRLRKVIDRARHAGHGTSVNKLCWTAYENELISASDDRTLSVWQLTEAAE